MRGHTRAVVNAFQLESWFNHTRLNAPLFVLSVRGSVLFDSYVERLGARRPGLGPD